MNCTEARHALMDRLSELVSEQDRINHMIDDVRKSRKVPEEVRKYLEGLPKSKDEKVKVVFQWATGSEEREFPDRDSAREWIMEGMAGTEGAEQEHYTSMLIQLEHGKTVLRY